MLLIIALLAASPALPTEQSAIFVAAGFTKANGHWRTSCDEQGADTYEPGKIETYRDLNGDGRPEAVVTEGSGFCYGDTGTGFWLLTKSAGGGWTKLYQSPGMPEFLRTSGVAKMPDLSVGGPGFCFPVLRWNGKAYVHNRYEYEGKACKPQR